ncbi:hypothetical protein KP509_09G034600 [Ceratopteris richardii]|nr:hypothetical protein KP509_09G034600 [Ceratopteris richardii]
MRPRAFVKDSNMHGCKHERNLSLPDRWMEECVCDIVKNINEAPSLHMLYNVEDGKSAVRSWKQKVEGSPGISTDDKWKEVRDLIKSSSPDGVILVQHLDDETVKRCCLGDGLSLHSREDSSDEESSKCCQSTNLWGLLVAGKDVTKIACYILKTTSVSSSYGSCIQFCLTKAKCFGPSWHEQLQSCWLVSTNEEK